MKITPLVFTVNLRSGKVSTFTPGLIPNHLRKRDEIMEHLGLRCKNKIRIGSLSLVSDYGTTILLNTETIFVLLMLKNQTRPKYQRRLLLSFVSVVGETLQFLSQHTSLPVTPRREKIVLESEQRRSEG